MPPTLLFVDDNLPLARTVTAFICEIRPEWRFWVVGTCAEARQVYHQRRPDLAILDVALPDGNGLNLLLEFKLIRPDLPVIIISGDDPEPLAQESLARGGHSFFSKPFSVLTLVATIESAIPLFAYQPQAAQSPKTTGARKNPFALVPLSTNRDLVVYDPMATKFNWFFPK
ncbi:MAG: response regulator [Desulfatibacillaceae bacterium]|nr:response regulator [Desulfatibacillaceae bacterium]